MTRPHRRDRDTKNASVCTGLRLEPRLAQLLCDEARARAMVGNPPRADVAMMARALIRAGLGIDADTSDRMEDEGLKTEGLCGLRLEGGMRTAIQRYGKKLGLGESGAARHLLRIGLGVGAAESLRREQRFTSLAQALREVREA